MVDLATAHNEHASPLATLMGDNLADGTWSSADIAAAKGHIDAIGMVLVAHIEEVTAMRSPTFAGVILNAQKAYAGYSQGALALKAYVAKLPDASFVDPDMVDGLDGLRSGQDAMTVALDDLALLAASGTIDCDVPIF